MSLLSDVVLYLMNFRADTGSVLPLAFDAKHLLPHHMVFSTNDDGDLPVSAGKSSLEPSSGALPLIVIIDCLQVHVDKVYRMAIVNRQRYQAVGASCITSAVLRR